MEVTQGQEEANTSQPVSPSTHSRYCCPCEGFRRGLSHVWSQHQIKSPFPWYMAGRPWTGALASWGSGALEGVEPAILRPLGVLTLWSIGGVHKFLLHLSRSPCCLTAGPLPGELGSCLPGHWRLLCWK